MKPNDFVHQIDESKLVEAITQSERQSSGEIRVYISHQKPKDIMGEAKARFEKLGMTKTRLRNGVLICVAPLSQEFAIIGDAGINEKCGEGFWHETAKRMVPRLKGGQYTEAIVGAIQEIGALMARHFPRQENDRDELPNQIVKD